MNETQATPRPVPRAAPAERSMFTLIRAAHVLEERLEESLGAVGLSGAKLSVLHQLAEADMPLALSELATCQHCVRSNITQLVDRLERDGFVRRVADPDDRRSVRASLTAPGREREADGTRIVKAMEAKFSASLSERDRGALERALAALK